MSSENNWKLIVACALISASISILASSSVLLLFSDKTESSPRWAQELEHHLVKRDIGDDCLNDINVGLAPNDSVSRLVRNLACDYNKLQQQIDTAMDEITSVAFFINEIGMNIQAAKAEIQTNKQLIFITQISSDEALNSTRRIENLVSDSRTKLDRFQRHFNVTLHAQNRRLNNVDKRTQRLRNAVRQASSANARLSANQQSGSAKADFDVNSTMFQEFNRRSADNKQHVLAIRNSITQIKQQLNKFTTLGWFNAPNGYQYFLSKSAYVNDPFTRSRRYCQHHDAELSYVGMRDEDTFRFLWYTLIAPAQHHCVWIGMTDIAVEGQWKWLDGQPVDKYWTNWVAGRSGVRSSLKDCGLIRAGKWNDAECNGYRKTCSFLCERKIINL